MDRSNEKASASCIYNCPLKRFTKCPHRINCKIHWSQTKKKKREREEKKSDGIARYSIPLTYHNKARVLYIFSGNMLRLDLNELMYQD